MKPGAERDDLVLDPHPVLLPRQKNRMIRKPMTGMARQPADANQ